MQGEKLKKICDDFSLLKEEQQDYVLGIMQALVFAKNTIHAEPGKAETSDTSSSAADSSQVLH
jgi:hypothetical protein